MKKAILVAVFIGVSFSAAPQQIDYTKADAAIVKDNQQDTAMQAIRDSKNSVIFELRKILEKLLVENKQLKESIAKDKSNAEKSTQ